MADALDRRQQAHLGEILRAEYQTVVEETLPERLGHVLDALDRCGEEAEATKADVAPS